MDHEKIVEAADEARKAKKAVEFFETYKEDLVSGLLLAGLGNLTNAIGGRKAVAYLSEAMTIYREEIVTFALERARADVRNAEAEIRKEAAS